VARKLGGQVDTSDVVGILTSAAITEDDILLGRYDGALVETFRVNWRDTSVRDLVSRTTIGEITREDAQFKAELRSGQQALNVVKGRIYQSLCDAALGDARCTIDLTDARYHATATVIALRDRYRLEIGGVSGFDAGWFGLGAARWTSGRRNGSQTRSRTISASALPTSSPSAARSATGSCRATASPPPPAATAILPPARRNSPTASTFAAFRTSLAMM
jgi:uncharacterized phage protein (TIGR02218 family)